MGSCWSASRDVEVEVARRRHVHETVYHRSPVVRSVQRHVHETVYNSSPVVRSVQAPVQTYIPVVPSRASRSCYGEFICPRCGHSWHSLLTWSNVCQACRKCGTNVQPRNQREVRPSDITRRKDSYHKHPEELCQRCKQLGYHCSKSLRKSS